MNISIFGGSQPKEGDIAYAEAQELGKLLAQRGHTVLTGGYIGTMEAVSRGASDAGGRPRRPAEAALPCDDRLAPFASGGCE